MAVRRVLYVAFFLEVGFVLVVAPWSGYWDQNYFLQEASLIRDVLTNNFVRGGISGLGLVNICVGVSDVAARFLSRAAARHAPVHSVADEP